MQKSQGISTSVLAKSASQLTPIQWLLVSVAVTLLLLAGAALTRDLHLVKIAIVTIPFLMAAYGGTTPVRRYPDARWAQVFSVIGFLAALGVLATLWQIFSLVGLF